MQWQDQLSSSIPIWLAQMEHQLQGPMVKVHKPLNQVSILQWEDTHQVNWDGNNKQTAKAINKCQLVMGALSNSSLAQTTPILIQDQLNILQDINNDWFMEGKQS